jgi:hypothetical protein
MDAEPITPDWLLAHGWRIATRRVGHELEVWRRAVGDELAGGRPFLGAHDDLCIDVSPAVGGAWHCWVTQADPHRFLHVRMMRTGADLARLYEGLTGRDFSPPQRR